MLNNTELEYLKELKSILNQEFNDLVDSIYFYGSRLTKNKQDSDFDILILTKKKIDWHLEFEIFQTIINYGIQNDIVFDPQFLTKNEFEIKYNYLPYVRSVQTTGIII